MCRSQFDCLLYWLVTGMMIAVSPHLTRRGGVLRIAPGAEMPLEPAEIGPTSHADMGGRITMIEQLGPSYAIGTDGRQWIVLKANGRANPRHPLDGWDATGFVHSDKQELVACIKAKVLKLSAAGRTALKRQGDRIWRWRTHADGVRQTIGACGQAENSAVQIGIDALISSSPPQ